MLSRAFAVLAAGLLGLALVPPAQASADGEVFLVAGLRGANEVGTAGDPDGSATVALRVAGDQVSFAIRWDKLDAPKLADIHLGAKGVNGEVKLDLVDGQLPANALGVSGTATADPAVLSALAADPTGFYADLHNSAFPSGAARGQFHQVSRKVDLRGVLQGADQATFSAEATGTRSATWWLRPSSSALDYTITWQGVQAPTAGTVSDGAYSRTELFTTKTGLPANLTGISGKARPVRQLDGQRASLEAPGGAVQATVSGAPFTHPRSFSAEVLLGSQIYICANNAFGQFGVTAKLKFGIDHSFVQPVTGPPQWVAADHSSVQVSSVFGRFPNGTGNIPELVLEVSQSGAATGLLSQATQVLRLNTQRGVAPAGPCTDGDRASSPYKADYLFLG
ncbi:CHRD domain-containing protein [Nonomuraea sp. NPDC050556]|uniref:CHRD domain-containing protein n=1 Tax=Nonomuraea sp. NPDC050556 TaxID=3364369 RepID=UPI0037AE17F6